LFSSQSPTAVHSWTLEISALFPVWPRRASMRLRPPGRSPGSLPISLSTCRFTDQTRAHCGAQGPSMLPAFPAREAHGSADAPSQIGKFFSLSAVLTTRRARITKLRNKRRLSSRDFARERNSMVTARRLRAALSKCVRAQLVRIEDELLGRE